MNTTYKTSKVVMTAAVLAALFAGCERREETAAPGAATGPAGTTIVTPDTTAGATATPPAATTESSGTAASSSAAAAGNNMENPAKRAGDKAESAADAAGDKAASSTESAGNAIDETVITGKVKAALLADERVKGLDIDVETKQNEVMLSGFVDNQSQIDNAEKIAKNIEGVNKVTNKLAVKK